MVLSTRTLAVKISSLMIFILFTIGLVFTQKVNTIFLAQLDVCLKFWKELCLAIIEGLEMKNSHFSEFFHWFRVTSLTCAKSEVSSSSTSGLLYVSETVSELFCEWWLLFTGQCNTVVLWCSRKRTYMLIMYMLADSQVVNEKWLREPKSKNNLERLFSCEHFSTLASLLLFNAAFVNSHEEYCLSELRFFLNRRMQTVLLPHVTDYSPNSNDSTNTKGPGRP